VLTAFGAGLNFGIYMAWLAMVGTQALDVLVGVALGSAAALSVNYGVSRRYVFAR
jgi:hypothetical protein